jgi:hypothetical protein
MIVGVSVAVFVASLVTQLTLAMRNTEGATKSTAGTKVPLAQKAEPQRSGQLSTPDYGDLNPTPSAAGAVLPFVFVILVAVHVILSLVALIWVAIDARNRGDDNSALWMIVVFVAGLIGQWPPTSGFAFLLSPCVRHGQTQCWSCSDQCFRSAPHADTLLYFPTRSISLTASDAVW